MLTLISLVGTGLWLSGGLWLIFHYFMRPVGEFGPEPHALEPWWLALHGFFAFLSLTVIGPGAMLDTRADGPAAQTLLRKFSGQPVQAILVGLLHGGTPNSYYKKLASNLRGRVLQLFPPLPVAEAESQHAGRPTLYCLLGPEGLYAGVASPVATNGFYPGGAKHLPHEAVDAISRAGAKVAEALHYLRLHRAALPKGAHWLELGASPAITNTNAIGYRRRAGTLAARRPKPPPCTATSTSPYDSGSVDGSASTSRSTRSTSARRRSMLYVGMRGRRERNWGGRRRWGLRIW